MPDSIAIALGKFFLDHHHVELSSRQWGGSWDFDVIPEELVVECPNCQVSFRWIKGSSTYAIR